MKLNNGAETLARTLLKGGVDLCFANPGTSEMHFVAALDQVEGMRCVLGLFEGVLAGAADGYARMADRPAATLMHLMPGLGNATANLHNARRAQVPMVNIVGEHRQGHKETDSPLTGDIEGVARAVSDWVRTVDSADDIAADTAQSIREARTLPGRIATLVVPANTTWSPASPGTKLDFDAPAPTFPTGARFSQAARALKSGEKTVMVLAGRALREEPLQSASRIALHCNAQLVMPSFTARVERGAGRTPIIRTPPPVDLGIATFQNAKHVILIGAPVPAPLFGYPGKPDYLVARDTNLIELTTTGDDLQATIDELAARVGATDRQPLVQAAVQIDVPRGSLSADAVMRTVAAMLPEHAVLVDESISAGRSLYAVSAGAPRHDLLQLTGGAIGQGLPLATGAALACPDRKVLTVVGDGSSLYTIQALWTQARERLDIVTLILANRGYQVLKGELVNVGARHLGERAERLLSLTDPDVSWVKLAGGMGVEGAVAHDCEQLARLLQGAVHRRGPFLIEVRMAG